MSNKGVVWLAAGFVLLGTLRIVATYSIFNHTIDEPAHIACGMQWLDQGKYDYEAMHPPLARVMTAVGPYLAGARSQGRPEMYREGAAILYGKDGTQYESRLTLARLGILPFFWLSCAVVFLWSARWFGREVAAAAVVLFTSLPAVLAHSGLATTDMALAATLGAAFYAGMQAIEEPTLLRGAIFGFTAAAAILSKLTALPFLAAGAGAAALVYAAKVRPGAAALVGAGRRLAAPAGIAAAVMVLVTWAGYRFSMGPGGPAPEFFGGIEMARHQVAQGHPSYLLGARSQSGFWYYYPVALAVKLPLGFLALGIAGIIIGWKRKASEYWIPTAIVAGILIFTAFSTINIGIRHVLPVHLFLSILAGVCVVEWLRSSRRWLAVALGGWLILSSALSHPDYLSYFNALADGEPEKVLVDSDLDWGQDMKRLAERLRRSNAKQVHFNPLILAHLEAVHGFPPIADTDPVQPETGWTAVSLTVLKATRLGLYNEHAEIDPWPNRVQPLERVGKGIYLYYFHPKVSR